MNRDVVGRRWGDFTLIEYFWRRAAFLLINRRVEMRKINPPCCMIWAENEGRAKSIGWHAIVTQITCHNSHQSGSSHSCSAVNRIFLPSNVRRHFRGMNLAALNGTMSRHLEALLKAEMPPNQKYWKQTELFDFSYGLLFKSVTSSPSHAHTPAHVPLWQKNLSPEN